MSVLVFIPLLMGGSSEYDRHHLRQGLLLFIVGVVASLGAWLWFPIWAILNLGIIAVSLYGCVQALQGQKWTMPILGRYALKIKL